MATSDRATNGARAWLLRIALLAASSIVSLLLAEVAFRVIVRRQQHDDRTDDAWRRALRRMNRTIYRRSDDPTLVYEPAPGASIAMPYGEAGFNHAGMRDGREHNEARDARVRVAVLGDSIVWGEEVDRDDSIPIQLQRALGDGVEVLPFGVSGYDSQQEAAWYLRAVRRFHPDVVVLVYCLNDIFIASGPFYQFATASEARRKDDQDAWFDRVAPVRAETLESLAARAESEAHFRVLSRAAWWLREAWFQRSDRYTDEYLVAYRDAPHLERVRGALASLHEAAARDGAIVHFVVSPVLRDWQRYHWSGVHTRLLDLGRALGFTVHDPLGAWRGRVNEASLRLQGDSIHYGPHGAQAFAGLLAGWLRADLDRLRGRAP
jgi:hypothetical protein